MLIIDQIHQQGTKQFTMNGMFSLRPHKNHLKFARKQAVIISFPANIHHRK
jgi:hypothetical protein